VGERQIAKLLRGAFPAVRRRVSGEESQDESSGRDLDGLPGFCAQVHWGQRGLVEKWKQAAAVAGKDEKAVLFSKKTGGEWIVTLSLEGFLGLVREGRCTNGTSAQPTRSQP
jgi:hypothetical protein